MHRDGNYHIGQKAAEPQAKTGKRIDAETQRAESEEGLF
jgi:hypothetical protein